MLERLYERFDQGISTDDAFASIRFVCRFDQLADAYCIYKIETIGDGNLFVFVLEAT